MKVKGLRRIGLSMVTCKEDNYLLERSKAARAGQCVIQLAVLVRSIEPALVLISVLLLTGITLVQPAFAQVQGGTIFGQNDQAVGNGVREAIRWGRNLLFLLGVVGVSWGAMNIWLEKGWGKQMLGGGLCMGIGGILSLIYSFSQGNAVNLDTDLGN
jgi:hypothetical protein